MEWYPSPREARQARAQAAGRRAVVARGGAARLRLLAEVEAKRLDRAQAQAQREAARLAAWQARRG